MTNNESIKRGIFIAIFERRQIVSKYEGVIKVFEEQIEQAEETINDLVRAAKNELDQESATALARELYWDWEEDIKAEPLRILLGLPSTNLVSKTVGPTEVIAQCNECGEDAIYTVTSRTALKEFDTSRRRRLTFRCNECQKAQRAELAKWREREESRRQRLAELRAMLYQEYLQTPEWDQTRQAALKRASYHCSVCNAGNCELHVHHRSYQNLGRETNRDVIVLCKDCHKLFHEQSGIKS